MILLNELREAVLETPKDRRRWHALSLSMSLFLQGEVVVDMTSGIVNIVAAVKIVMVVVATAAVVLLLFLTLMV